jgi:UDP-N-acetylglucosamine:LPS N-acetylglucosamine transferase
MQRLLDVFKVHDYFFVTYASESTSGTPNSYLLKYSDNINALRNKLMLVRTFYDAIKIILKERPNVIVTTGGGEIAVPFCYIGKLFGAKIIFIETLARIHEPSGGGRFIYPIADLFLVQWRSLLKVYGKKAKYWGNVI